MASNKLTGSVRLITEYPIRADSSVNLTSAAMKEMCWPYGMLCRIELNFDKGCIEVYPGKAGIVGIEKKGAK